jgi:2-polyprenyl-6-hydroxyphenyl methylase/3-demethylubiquinone-9 3-methyltransferase
VAVMAKFLKQGGAILFSTLVQPAEFEKVGLNWWYAAPRNGHLSLHSAESLKRVFEPFGLAVDSFNEGFHLAHGRLA